MFIYPSVAHHLRWLICSSWVSCLTFNSKTASFTCLVLVPPSPCPPKTVGHKTTRARVKQLQPYQHWILLQMINHSIPVNLGMWRLMWVSGTKACLIKDPGFYWLLFVRVTGRKGGACFTNDSVVAFRRSPVDNGDLSVFRFMLIETGTTGDTPPAEQS